MPVNKTLSNLLLRVISHTLKKAAMDLDMIEFILVMWIQAERQVQTDGNGLKVSS